jgi:hypothetical protein
MKYFLVIFILTFFAGLNSTMWINPVSEVIFGPCDISISGGIDLAVTKKDGTLKEKAAGVYFDSASRIVFTGSSEDTLKNIYAMNNVTINKPSGNLAIMQDLNISGNINFVRGHVTTGSDTLVLYLSTSTISGENSNGYVSGNMKSKRFIGTGTSASSGHFGGVGFSINDTGNDIGTVTVHRKAGRRIQRFSSRLGRDREAMEDRDISSIFGYKEHFRKLDWRKRQR